MGGLSAVRLEARSAGLLTLLRISLDPVELITGSLPRRQRRLVEAWAELHQAELRADWERLQQGRKPFPMRRSSEV